MRGVTMMTGIYIWGRLGERQESTYWWGPEEDVHLVLGGVRGRWESRFVKCRIKDRSVVL